MSTDTEAGTAAFASTNIDTMPGYVLLARMGKRVLRPGGRELTKEVLDELAISGADQVVEFAPGLGATAQLILRSRPAGYLGVERDEQAAAALNARIVDNRYHVLVSSAQKSNLADCSADVVMGEAMLSMQSDDNKKRIIDEAFRILRPGGRYGIHELCLKPGDLDTEIQSQVQGDLSRAIRVGARPMTPPDWRALLEEAGFEIRHESTVPQRLLEPRRLIQDEGLLRAARVICNVLRSRQARKRVITMRKTFRRHADHLAAIGIVANKPWPDG